MFHYVLFHFASFKYFKQCFTTFLYLLRESRPVGSKSTSWEKVYLLRESLPVGRKSTRWEKVYLFRESLPVGRKSACWGKVHLLGESLPIEGLPVGRKSTRWKIDYSLEECLPVSRKSNPLLLGVTLPLGVKLILPGPLSSPLVKCLRTDPKTES